MLFHSAFNKTNIFTKFWSSAPSKKSDLAGLLYGRLNCIIFLDVERVKYDKVNG